MNDLSHPILPANQSAFPDRWVDLLFQRLHALYGKHWADLWEGVPLADVKDAWQEVLANASADQVKRALAHCQANSKFPPTAPEFASLCRDFRPPPSTLPALPPARDNSPIPEQIQIETAKLKGGKKDPRDWARKLMAQHAAGERLLPIQLTNAREALGLK